MNQPKGINRISYIAPSPQGALITKIGSVRTIMPPEALHTHARLHLQGTHRSARGDGYHCTEVSRSTSSGCGRSQRQPNRKYARHTHGNFSGSCRSFNEILTGLFTRPPISTSKTSGSISGTPPPI